MFWIKDLEDDALEYTPGCHVPVMLKEVLEYLRPQPGWVFLDCTVGLAGHSKAIANIIGEKGHLIGTDQDKNALAIASENLKNSACKVDLIHGNFRDVDETLKRVGVQEVDGILLDLGVSSLQLDNSQRGFAIREDGPLDMRMNSEALLSARDLINSLSEEEIEHILREFGEERFSRRIARVIVQQRIRAPFITTQDLIKAVLKAMPKNMARQRIHPATRTFQAFRIAVNRELESLEIVLDKAIPLLKSSGRIGVIAFHSLEDRIVKNKFRRFAGEGTLQLITRKPLRPSEEEISCNSRSRSARLRIGEKSNAA